MKPSDIPFQTLCSFFNVVAQKSKTLKHKHLRHFREKFIERTSEDVFSIYRLMAPALDRERSNYGLKEANLVRFLIRACLLDPKTSTAAQRAENWRQAGIKNAGQFSKVMEEYLFKACCGRQSGTPEEMKLTVGQLNQYLDQLANDVENNGKVKVLTQLLQVTTPNQMKWIIQILLKDLKIGLSETTVLKDYHKDALDRYNVTCDFPTVIRELVDPHKRFPFQDITVGNPAKAQLARAVRNPEEAFNLMKGSFFVVETKFDGERMQVHIMPEEGQEVRYYSRRAIEHGEHSHYTVLDKFVTQQLSERGIILDAEVVVWNKVKKIFEPFGGMKSAVIAARDNEPGETRLKLAGFNGDQMTSDPDYEQPLVKELELVLVVFDILYCRGQSVINQELRDRQKLLQEILIPAPESGIPVSGAMTGRVVALLPGVPLMNGVPGSKLSTRLEDIQEKFEESVRVGEEGIVVKAANSPWRCNDRGNAWLKIKPDYLQEVEIDALIIGLKYGTGRRSGVLSEYLLALAEKPQNGASRPSSFVSFCMVGTGVNDVERKTIDERLEGNKIEQNPAPAKYVAPRCYKVTGAKKERPDVWVKDPSRSIVLQIQADVRTIMSKTFASRHSLRFPRCVRVRWDKSPMDIQTDQDLWEIVESNKGAIVGAGGETTRASPKKKQKRPTPKEAGAQRAQRSTVIEQFAPASVAGVIQESSALKGTLVYFVPSYSRTSHSKAELEAMVARLGGKVSQNYIPRVSHIIAQSASEETFRARQAKRDMISLDWLLECARERRLVPLRPHHFLNLTRKTLEEVDDVCKYGDMYYEDVADLDISAIINHHAHMEDIDVNALAADMASEQLNGLPSPGPPSGKAKKISVKGLPTGASITTIMAHVDSLLSLKGLLDHSSCLFRGCSVCVVSLPPPANALGSEADSELLSCARDMHATAEISRKHLGPWDVKQYGLKAKMYGGAASADITAGTTHVIVVPAAASSTPEAGTGQPGHLLGQLLREHGGLPALKTLHRRLQSQQAHVVTQSWLDQSLATLDDSAARMPPHRVPEAEHQLTEAGAATASQHWATWPWEEYGVSSAPTPSVRSKRSRASAESSEGSEHVGAAKRARRSRASGAASKDAGKTPAKRKAAPRTKAAPLAPPVGTRQRGAGRGRARTKSERPPDPKSEDEEAGEQPDERSESLQAQAGQADVSVPAKTEPYLDVRAEEAYTADSEQPGSAKAAEGPATLLEELLSLPAPEYDSLASRQAEGQHLSGASERLSQGRAARKASPDQLAMAAAQPGCQLEAQLSLPRDGAADGDTQQQDMGSPAAAAKPVQAHEALHSTEASAAPEHADSAAEPHLSLRERIRMLKGAGQQRTMTAGQ